MPASASIIGVQNIGGRYYVNFDDGSQKEFNALADCPSEAQLESLEVVKQHAVARWLAENPSGAGPAAPITVTVDAMSSQLPQPLVNTGSGPPGANAFNGVEFYYDTVAAELWRK